MIMGDGWHTTRRPLGTAGVLGIFGVRIQRLHAGEDSPGRMVVDVHISWLTFEYLDVDSAQKCLLVPATTSSG